MIRALERSRFGGKDYSAGEVVPREAINPQTFNALIDMGVIEVVADPPPKPKPTIAKTKKR